MRISDWSSDVCSSDLRFQRQAGRDVRFQTGTDEHGLKMVQTARDRGVPVRALADDMSGYFQDMAAKLNISHDRFIRTVEPDHHAARSEAHTSDLQSLMLILYTVFSLQHKMITSSLHSFFL